MPISLKLWNYKLKVTFPETTNSPQLLNEKVYFSHTRSDSYFIEIIILRLRCGDYVTLLESVSIWIRVNITLCDKLQLLTKLDCKYEYYFY